jgi:hypothetical protein
MRSIFIFLGLLSLSLKAETFRAPLRPIDFNEVVVREDLSRILQKASLPVEFLDFKFVGESSSSIELLCSNNKLTLLISAHGEERTSALYKSLRELGFLFPHPEKQISPNFGEMKKNCGRKWSWKPALKFRGFHLHTLHPNEWVAAFYQGKTEVGEKLIRWLARNQQNIFDLSLLDAPLPDRSYFELARGFQIHTGVSLGIALNQQNSYKLLSLWDSYFGFRTDKKIEEGLLLLMNKLPLSYVVLEAGTSEFTPTDFDKTLKWLDLAGEVTRSHNVSLFTKVHVSSNQVSKKWGNFNFLPQYSKAHVGILPHTVMFYGLDDEKAPMYGNKNFHSIRDFMLKEKTKRPVWYYPETSYWVGMDVDVPLFLTDYLRTRADDMKLLAKNGIEGQLNFTTGHGLGYWLFDWSLTLLNDLDYHFDPLIGTKLIGENPTVWEKILKYQAKWYKDKGLIALLSSANLQDELSGTHRIHDRFTMKDLSSNPERIKEEILLLENSLQEFPEISNVKNEELKSLLLLNHLRHEHALQLRRGFLNKNSLAKAKLTREKALHIISDLRKLPDNYPDLQLFLEWNNPTAYQFGYLYPAARLYFWEREENQVRQDSYFPFRGNIYDVFDIVF